MAGHIHNHEHKAPSLKTAFIVGISVNALYVIVELFAGFYYNSLSLISDAGHNLSDVAALALALLAFRLSKVKATDKFTYGFRKSTILVSLINSVVLFIAIGGIFWESISRWNNPVIIEGNSIAVIAGIGIIVNSVSAFLFFRDKDSDLNAKGAYLHMLADAAVSLGVVISGILMLIFHIYWLDTLMSLIIVIVIFYSTWKLFKDSLSLTLDGVPKGVNLQTTIDILKKIDGVIDLHHIHIWAISTSENAMTVHIIISTNTSAEKMNSIKKNIKHALKLNNIQHATLEFETECDHCHDTDIISEF
jgi:cobalt-zinc-cadmium efflux system protein